MPKRRLSFTAAATARKRSRRSARRPARSRSRRSNRNVVSTVGSANSPLPARFFVSMKYADVVDLTPGASGTSSAVYYNLNNIYDPYAGVGGHQAYGFDQFSPLYRKYRVHSVKWTLTQGSGGATNSYYYAVPDNNGNPLSGFLPYEIMEVPRIRYRAVDQSDASVIRGHIRLRHLAGVSKAEYNDDTYSGTTAGVTPGEVMRLAVGGFSNGGTTTVLGILRITYMVEFFDPTLIASS